MCRSSWLASRQDPPCTTCPRLRWITEVCRLTTLSTCFLAERTGLPHRFGQSPQIFLARDRNPAHLRSDRRQHLDVEQRKAARSQVLEQAEQGHFRRIAHAVEHGLARKKA